MSVRNLLSCSCSSCSSKLRCCSRSSTGLAEGGHTCAGVSPLLASERRTLTESQGRTSLTVLSPSSSQSSQLCSYSKGTNIGNAWSPKARKPRPSTQRVVGNLSASG